MLDRAGEKLAFAYTEIEVQKMLRGLSDYEIAILMLGAPNLLRDTLLDNMSETLQIKIMENVIKLHKRTGYQNYRDRIQKDINKVLGKIMIILGDMGFN